MYFVCWRNILVLLWLKYVIMCNNQRLELTKDLNGLKDSLYGIAFYMFNNFHSFPSSVLGYIPFIVDSFSL